MSYAGGQDYFPVDMVDESIHYTDMQGQASALNQKKNPNASWTQDPTKSLVALWVFVLLTYMLMGFFFRRYLA